MTIIGNGTAATFTTTKNEKIGERLDASFQGVSKLFVLAYQCGNNYLNEEAFNQ